MTLDILRDLGRPFVLESELESRDLRRVSNRLDDNPQLIRMFLKGVSEMTPGMPFRTTRVLRQLLLSVVHMSLEDPGSRMVRIAHTTFTNIGRLNHGHKLQKLLLGFAFFNNFIPCGLHDKFFFPSARSYLGYLTHCHILEWPTTADPGVVKQYNPLSQDPSLMYFQLSHLAEESEELFCVLVEQLLDSGLVDFPEQTEEITEMREAVVKYDSREEDRDISAVKELLAELAYLCISPVLTNYLRSQFRDSANSSPHGVDLTLLVLAYCSYYKSFSASRWDEHDSHQPGRSSLVVTSTPDKGEHFTSDSVYLHDTRNVWSAVHIALAMENPNMIWKSFPSSALLDLGNMATQRLGRPAWPYKALSTGGFTEETIFDMLDAVLSYWDSTPRAEQESPTPLRIACDLSMIQCGMVQVIGDSPFTKFDMDQRQQRKLVKRAIDAHRRLRKTYGTPGQPRTTQEKFLASMLEHITPGPRTIDDERLRRTVGDERWNELQQEQQENGRVTALVATAIMGGLSGSPFRQ